MAEHTGDKSQDPTPRRRQQTREAGQVAHSRDLSSAGLLLGALLILTFTGGTLLNFLGGMLGAHLSGGSWLTLIRSGAPADANLFVGQWNVLAVDLSKALLPVLGLILLLAVAVNVLQMGVWFLPGKLAPQFSRINPLAGLSRIVSTAGAVRLAFGLLKIGVVTGVAATGVYNQRHEIMALGGHDLPQIASLAWSICLGTCVRIGVALFVMAILDYGYQRWKHEQDMKMTPQEIREELRTLQGDPQLTARRRAMQRQMSQASPAQAVPKADVVITHPDETAVALRYDATRMAAPVVVAKGSGGAAARIRQLAREHGIPTVDKGSIAEALYEQVELNRPIPAALHAAVAEVLARVFRAKEKVG